MVWGGGVRTPFSSRRIAKFRRRSSRPDVALMQREMEAFERKLRETMLVNEHLRAELDEKNAEAMALRRVGEATGSAFDLEEMLKVAADIAIQVTGTDSCQVYLYDRNKEELVLRAGDITCEEMIGKIRLKMG